MPDVLVLHDDEVRALLPADELAAALREALVSLHRGETSVPSRVAARTPGGLLGAMPGYAPGLGLAAKLVSVYPGNAGRNVPSHHAVIAVFDEVTGAPEAILAGNWITAFRTAMTSLLAARALVRTDGPVAVLGAGVQGDAHLQASAALLPGRPLVLWSRRVETARAVAARYDGVTVAASAESAVREAGVVLCCTDAREPVVDDAWVGAGTHVGSVGTGAELPAGLLARATVVVESRASATLPPPAGAPELQGWDPAGLVELGGLLAGDEEAAADRAVTVFTSTGHAVEDVAAAIVVLRHAAATGAGRVVRL